MNPRSVAVTGADGFISSHLVKTLVTAGYRARAMFQYNSLGSWGWLDDVDQGVLNTVEIVRDFIARGQFRVSYKCDGYWLDIGRPNDDDRANDELGAIAPRLLSGLT